MAHSVWTVCAAQQQTETVITSVAVTAALQEPKKTVWDGVYTEEQAERGERSYQRACGHCHSGDLSGMDDVGAPPLRGFNFFFRWREMTAAAMFTTIKRTMPRNKPGTLSPEAIVDVMSFIFQANDIPPGRTELPPDPEMLEQILVADKPAKN